MIRFAILICALILPGAALAQRQTSGIGFRLGQEVKDYRDVGDEMKPQEMLLVTARCVAKKKPEEARAYLSALPATEAEVSAFEELGKTLNRCIPDMTNEIADERMVHHPLQSADSIREHGRPRDLPHRRTQRSFDDRSIVARLRCSLRRLRSSRRNNRR